MRQKYDETENNTFLKALILMNGPIQNKHCSLRRLLLPLWHGQEEVRLGLIIEIDVYLGL